MTRRRGSVTPFRGRWRVRYWLDGTRRSGGLYATRGEAEGILSALLERVSGKAHTTAATWGATWLDARELGGLKRDVRNERSRWRAHVLPEDWAHLPLTDLRRRDFAAWVVSMLSRGVAEQTARNALNLARCAMRSAVDAELIEANPADGVRVPRRPSTEDAWTWLTPAEIDAVLSAPMLSERERLTCAVAIYTGLRAGELWGLRWCDVELGPAPRLMVRHSYDGPTKGGKPREVGLIPAAIDALRAWREIAPGVGDALVFPAPHGGVWAHGYDGGWADRPEAHVTRLGARRRAGIARAVRFHDLRHTCATHLLAGTWGYAWRLEEVQRQLGHRSRVTTERYAHAVADTLHAAARATCRSRDTVRDTGHAARSGRRRK